VPNEFWDAAAQARSGERDFDFLAGYWRVRHRRLSRTTGDWENFEGTASHRGLMGNAANIEEHVLHAPAGTYHAVALRSHEAATGRWAIWWLDGRYPAGPLGPPVVGRFANGVGQFYADDVYDGTPIRVRFRWSDITDTSARWEQSFSSDEGVTWDPNWVMNFERVGFEPASVEPDPATSDFDFLRGEWHVRHRFLRKQGSGEWLVADGTASHTVLMGGAANMEEYTINAPSGRYHAMALRSYAPDVANWSIWWLDGRIPHGEIDPPMRGGFAGDVASFYGKTTVDGQTVQVRYIWSDVTESSARWEQAYLAEPGPWETNWVMEFRR